MAKANRYHGALRDRFSFEKRLLGGDGWGNSVPSEQFEPAFSSMVNLSSRSGSEAVIADNLQGLQPYVVVMRWSQVALNVTVGWIMREDLTRGNRVLNIISAPADPDGRRQWLEFLAVSGRPT